VIRQIKLSQPFAGQSVGVKQVEEKIWLVSFMRYDLGFFDHETCRIESAENPLDKRSRRIGDNRPAQLERPER